MKEIILDNNLKLIYKHSESELTSICISLNAGAGIEVEKIGVAHAVEHMVYKGTKTKSESQINEQLSSIFGFQNAMTNYPYVIYYGTLLNEDLNSGVELFSDIILNPEFDEKGFKEEMEVIKEELDEWDEEIEQFCEDKLFYNIFNKRRIKNPIIGTKESLDNLTVTDLKRFYEENYFPENTSISVITSIDFNSVKEIIDKYFGIWKSKVISRNSYVNNIEYEKIDASKIQITKRQGIKNAKVQMIFPLDKLNFKELNAFRLFNQYFGEGVNSVLFDALRTKNSLVYDVITRISNENYLKMYKITFTTSKENVNKAVELVMNLIKEINFKVELEIKLDSLIKSYKLKRLFREEQSIILAKELATYDTMFGDYNIYENELGKIDEITETDILNSAKKVLKNSAVQVVW
ncbi:M16 family metallopeptidase [Clostridium butyricum]|uniref:M16 family metallopeptidase n=1 Tax=Clostridium butyricum TaxID=1492 RepID=UPI00071C1549|nr:pitrilysin family protein [Clostridium butyricum]ALP89631.1 peptidase M16 [Clostridium butyricum]ALS16086.1 peptidase M16 [Clostridium butyricum]ANF13244.1 peptidase M16 [Clostridium butyricum]AOR93314.1 peptidase M16 [Clostridium butyricum]MCI3007428.1 insulinase family protein [Clostridium butyricum]